MISEGVAYFPEHEYWPKIVAQTTKNAVFRVTISNVKLIQIQILRELNIYIYKDLRLKGLRSSEPYDQYQEDGYLVPRYDYCLEVVFQL